MLVYFVKTLGNGVPNMSFLLRFINRRRDSIVANQERAIALSLKNKLENTLPSSN